MVNIVRRQIPPSAGQAVRREKAERISNLEQGISNFELRESSMVNVQFSMFKKERKLNVSKAQNKWN